MLQGAEHIRTVQVRNNTFGKITTLKTFVKEREGRLLQQNNLKNV